MKKQLLMVVIFLSGSLIYAESLSRVAILNFDAVGVFPDDAIIVSEIFRSKMIISNKFVVVERERIDQIIKEQEIQISGVTSTETAVKIGQILNVDYLIYGSLMKMGKPLNLVINVVDTSTGQIYVSVTDVLKDIDTIDADLTRMSLLLIKRFLTMKSGLSGKKEIPFTFSTEAEGFSVEAGVGYIYGDYFLRDTISTGYSVSLGFSGGRGKFWSGFYTVWSIMNNALPSFDLTLSEANPLICNFGALNLILGDKVNSFAIQFGVGGGYDFALGIVLSPSIGCYFKNFYFRYYPDLDLWVYPELKISSFNHFEIGYSLFLGSRGKKATEFR